MYKTRRMLLVEQFLTSLVVRDLNKINEET